MTKIDLHVHTVATPKDADFVFSETTLSRYVSVRRIDTIAITNHNVFELDQFRRILQVLSGITVLPGIEIDVDDGHLLLVGDGSGLQSFDSMCRGVTLHFASTPKDPLDVSALKNIFGDLSQYILIPHYQKTPAIGPETLAALRKYVTAGEVSSVKKFVYCARNSESLVPVLFSDARMVGELEDFPIRQTYIDAGTADFSSIRMCLSDSHKVSLSADGGHEQFDALPDGLRLSTGLNVLLGERSSGKSYTLDRIDERHENVKYIRQFSLLWTDDEKDKQQFEKLLSASQSRQTEEYLEEFRDIVASLESVDRDEDERDIENYLQSLIRFAHEEERKDQFSSAVLYSESNFPESRLDSLQKLIGSVEALFANTEYKSIIQEYVSEDALRRLLVRLMEEYVTLDEGRRKRAWLNDLMDSIRNALRLYTSAQQLPQIDLYQVALDRVKVQKFADIARKLRRPGRILEKDLQGYRMVAEVRPFESTRQLQNVLSRKMTLSDVFASYQDPYSLICKLREKNEIQAVDYYRFFARIEYRILNKHGFDVSGGERSEFRLLQEIKDAQSHEMLLIDEPESSFDNLFLRHSVNQLIRDLAMSLPVVVVTHNNTVGASIKPNWVVYAKRIVDKAEISYVLFTGSPADHTLRTPDGDVMPNLNAILDCLEAGVEAYQERSQTYASLKD